MTFFDSVQELYSHELYEEIIFLDELIPEKSRGSISSKNDGLLNAYMGEAYYQIDKWTHALRYYKIALDHFMKTPRGTSVKGFAEVDIRFKLYKILVRMKRYEEALGYLQRIPDNEQPLKVKYAIHKLIMARDVSNGTHHCLPIFGCIVNTCPSAIKSTSALLKSGMMNLEAAHVPFNLKNILPVKTYLEASSLIGQKLHRQAIDHLLACEEPSFRTLVDAGVHLYNIGYEREAMDALLKAHHIQSDRTTHMDLLAFLLHEHKREPEPLESLAIGLMREDPESVEANVALGYLTASTSNSHHIQALHIAYAACKITSYGKRPRTQALLLKSNILMAMEKYDEAVKHTQEAIRHDPTNFNLQQNLVNALIHRANVREARIAANAMYQAHPNDPRAHLMRAQILLKTGNAQSKIEAQKTLEQLIEDHPQITQTFWVLLDLYEKAGKPDLAKSLTAKLLKGSYTKEVMGKLNQMMASWCQKANDPEKAYEHVNKAVSNGIEDVANEVANIDVAMYQTPSPLAPAPRAPLPQAPRRNRPARMSSDMDTSGEFNAIDNTGNS